MLLWCQIILPPVVTFLASSGFWAFMQKRDKTATATKRLLLGLAYDKIISLGMGYLDRGWLTKDEFEEFYRGLYEPYSDCGGNGVAAKIVASVSELPIRTVAQYAKIKR